MFRFTIRDVLWLTVVVGLAVTWWLDRWSLRSELATHLRAAELREQQAQRDLNTFRLRIRVEEVEREALRQIRDAQDRQAWDTAKAKSQQLGAPQPQPIPD